MGNAIVNIKHCEESCSVFDSDSFRGLPQPPETRKPAPNHGSLTSSGASAASFPISPEGLFHRSSYQDQLQLTYLWEMTSFRGVVNCSASTDTCRGFPSVGFHDLIGPLHQTKGDLYQFHTHNNNKIPSTIAKMPPTLARRKMKVCWR